MVRFMEEKLKVDRQGRLVLPSHLRERLRLGGKGGTVSVRLDGSRIVIEPIMEDLEERVKEWRDMALTLRAEPFTEETEESWKWISLEYAKRKLGLH